MAKTRMSTPDASTNNPNALFPPSLGPIHVDRAKIAHLATTATGQQSLCTLFGDEGNGLDQASLDLAEKALLKEQVVEPACLSAVIRRLSVLVVRISLQDHFDHDIDSELKLEKLLLDEHPQETADAVRTRYQLGSSHPDSEALRLLPYLGLKSSCPDLRRSVQSMSSSEPSLGEFDALYKKLCASHGV